MASAQSVSAADLESVDRVLQAHSARADRLVQILGEVQAITHWLPREIIARIAAGLGLTPAIVFGVASFYRFFHLQPVAPLHFLWSDGITDCMLGSRQLAEKFCKRLGITPGKPSADAPASADYTSCTGLGDQGPSLLVNQHQVLTRMTPERVAELAAQVRAGVPIDHWPAEWQKVDDQVRRSDVLLGAPSLQGESIRAMLARGASGTFDELALARLRGRGGAGYSTVSKWRACLNAPCAPNATRVVVCNADEGEPGTFKDRVLLTRQAHTLFEGMTVAARLLDARTGLVYLRGEYRFLLEPLRAVLAQRRKQSLLGERILDVAGFDFDIDIHLGAGAYVCGEESSLIESLEGKRGTPRIRPPFPIERGYLDQPTSVNNVETLIAAAHIAARGGAWWSAIGTPQSTGTKVHAVSGDCARPGIYEYAFGVSINRVLDDCGAREGGRQVQAVQVGGPSGQCLAAHEFDRRICFEEVPSAGALMVFDHSRDMFEVARSFAHFFAHESCGFCTPCRVGTELVVRRMDKLAAGYGSVFDEQELVELESLLHGTSHCGLGATATNALRDTLHKFKPAYERRLQAPDFIPGFDLDAELSAARRVTGRDDAGAYLQRRS